MATDPPVGAMIRVALLGEDLAQSANPHMASKNVPMPGFYVAFVFHRTSVIIVCRYLFIVILNATCVAYGRDSYRLQPRTTQTVRHSIDHTQEAIGLRRSRQDHGYLGFWNLWAAKPHSWCRI